MSLDYDLVIIGNTPEAMYAASKAAKLKARVAWVVGDKQDDYYTEIDRYIFSYFTYLEQQWKTLTQGILNASLYPSYLNLSQIQTWIKQVKTNLNPQYSPETLAAMGVDVIFESGEFCRLPQQAFVLPSRKLRSRTYLVATGSVPTIPTIFGLSEVGYLTPETLTLETLSSDLIILAETPLGIELAQNLARIGKKISLLVPENQILPQEDPQIIQLLQAQLEADGIEIFTNSPITQIKQINDQKWVQAGNLAIEADDIILVMQQQPNIKDLNLEAVNVEITPQKIKVNQKLQTTNPQIYACGGVIGGYNVANIGQYEASIVVKNALFFPYFKVNYPHLPYAILTNPPVARIGLTQEQAKRRYGHNIIVAEDYFKTLPKAQILGETTGFFQVITRHNGEILGCHGLGREAEELIGAIALAMNHNLKIQNLAEVFPPSSSLFTILSQISHTWKTQKFEQNQFLTQGIETLLFWRRKWG